MHVSVKEPVRFVSTNEASSPPPHASVENVKTTCAPLLFNNYAMKMKTVLTPI